MDKQDEIIEMHFNKVGAEYLRNILDKLISKDKKDYLHFMSSDWGGEELSSHKQNLSTDVKLLHQLKIMYWKEY